MLWSMTARLQRPATLPLLLLLGSSSALLGALYFQYGLGLAPCALCYDQRYAHAAALVPAAIALLLHGRPQKLLIALAGLALLGSAGIAGYHVGVEQGWWSGPAGCSAPSFAHLDIQQLRAALEAAPVVRCDEIPWSLFGISMAGYNFLLSLTLAALALGWAVGNFRRSQ